MSQLQQSIYAAVDGPVQHRVRAAAAEQTHPSSATADPRRHRPLAMACFGLQVS